MIQPLGRAVPLGRVGTGTLISNLSSLLLSLFSGDELRRYLRALPDGDTIVAALPGPNSSPASFATEAATYMQRNGLIRRDLRHSVMNVMAIIVMFGLVVIPSLFTWFNVLASWDPCGNTKNLTVAVASTDEGYQSDLVPIRVNVGEQVLSQLRANDQLNWVITSEDDAIDGTKAGRYYAAIVLPPSFSADMLTFYSDGAQRTELAYYTNEKKNALAPKITGQGAEGVSAQISAVFTETLSDVALSLISSLSDFLTDADTQAALTRMEARVGSVATQLRAGAQTADMFGALVQGTIPLAQSASALVSGAGSAFALVAGAFTYGARGTGEGQGAVRAAVGSLERGFAPCV